MTERHFTLWWYRILVTSVFVAFGLTLGASAVITNELGGRMFSLAGAAFMLGLGLRASRCASVVLNGNGVIIRGMRSHKIAWDELATAEVGIGSSVASFAWRVPCFALTDGTVLCADEIRSMRTPSLADEVTDAVREELRHRSG